MGSFRHRCVWSRLLIPQGWYIQWQDDELANIPAGGSASATLSITVPSDAAPDFYGYRLTIGSTNGNITSSTIIVVEVEAEPSASAAFLRQSDVFLPGASTTTGVQVTNTGNTPLNIDWTLSVPPSAGTSACTASLVTPQTLSLQPDAVGEVELMVDVDENADSSAQCPLRLTGHHAVDDATVLLEELDFTIESMRTSVSRSLGPWPPWMSFLMSGKLRGSRQQPRQR